MERKKHVVDAQAKLQTGNYVKGSVTTLDDDTYHFRNVFSDLDFYVYMRKGDNGWYQSGGPQIQWPQHMIDELGAQIDAVLG